MSDLEKIRATLAHLKQELQSGELDHHSYLQLKMDLLEGLSESDIAEFQTSTPSPTEAQARFGPSGSLGSGVRTRLPEEVIYNLKQGEVLFDQWEVLEELGRGGFGVVYKTKDLHLGEILAVKVLDPSMVRREDLLARFRREVSVCRRLAHRRIVRVFDYRENLDEYMAMVTMEFVTGVSLRDLNAFKRKVNQRIPSPIALEIVSQTLEALEKAHSHDVIHRDVTPGNIMLAGADLEQIFQDPDTEVDVKLVDFGIAALAERSELSSKSQALGTAAYVAPEILSNSPEARLTPAVDLYSVGAVAYELFTGRLALGRYERPSALRSGLPEELDTLVADLLSTEPSSRPNASEAKKACFTLRPKVRELWIELDRVRIIERNLRTALGAEDEGLLQSILDGLESEDVQVSEDLLARARSWLQLRAEQRELAAQRRQEEEEGLREALRTALETTDKAGGDDEVLQALEDLGGFLGAAAASDPQLVEAQQRLERRAVEIEGAREAIQRVERHRRELASRLEEVNAELSGALEAGNEELVRLCRDDLLELKDFCGPKSIQLLSEAEDWLATLDQEREDQAAQRQWAKEQAAKKNRIEKLRARLEIAMGSDDEEEAQEAATELTRLLGTAASSDADLQVADQWLRERESVRRSWIRDRQQHEEALSQERLRQESAIRSSLATAIDLGVREEVESRLEELEELLGNDAETDDDLLRGRRWLARPRRKWLKIGAATLVSCAALVGLIWLFPFAPEETGQDPTRTAPPDTKPGYGQIEIRSNVPRDLVRLNSKALGPTPQFLRLPEGTHEIEVSKDGCESEQRAVTVNEKDSRVVRFVLDCSG